VVVGSPNNPGKVETVTGQISMHTLVGLYANEGTGQDGLHIFVIFYP